MLQDAKTHEKKKNIELLMLTMKILLSNNVGTTNYGIFLLYFYEIFIFIFNGVTRAFQLGKYCVRWLGGGLGSLLCDLNLTCCTNCFKDTYGHPEGNTSEDSAHLSINYMEGKVTEKGCLSINNK